MSAERDRLAGEIELLRKRIAEIEDDADSLRQTRDVDRMEKESLRAALDTETRAREEVEVRMQKLTEDRRELTDGLNTAFSMLDDISTHLARFED